MSDLIAAGVIEFTGDASGVSAAAAQVVQASKTVESAYEGIGKSAEKTAVATEGLSKSQERLLLSIDKEAAALSMSRSEYRAFEAQLKGIPETVYAPYIRKLEEAATAQDRFVGEQTFNRKANDAAQLVKASGYVQFWENALREAETQEKEFAATTAFNQKAAEAAKLVQASDYVRFWETSLERAEAQEREFATTTAFNQKVAEAAKLNQASEYVRFWEDALEKAEIEERKFANDQAFITGLQRKADAVSKLPSALLEAEAAQRGLSAQAAPYIAQLRAQETALKGATQATGAYVLQGKALAAALRGVPAQFTDIVVSLQGGQAPLTVLLQQGGQLKDMFNGVGPAIRAVSGYIVGLITPLTVAAAAVAALTYAYYKGSQEQSAYVKALAATGNQAGVTAGQLADLARRVSSATGATQGAAAEALTALVATGKVTGANDLQQFAETAIRVQRTLGTSVADTAKQYAELGKDPVSAVKRLNESMNFLTQAQYEQIKALVEANRETEAAAVAQKAFDDAQRKAASQVEENLGFIERGWRSIKDAVTGAYDAVLAFGRAPAPSQQLSDIAQQVERLRASSQAPVRDPNDRFGNVQGVTAAQSAQAKDDLRIAELKLGIQQESNRLLDRAARSQAEANEIQRKGIAATDEVKKLQDQAKGVNAVTRELEQYRKKIADIRAANPNSELVDPKAIAAGEAAIRKAHQGSQRKAPEFRDDEATKLLLSLKEQEAALREQLDTENKITEAQKKRAAFEQLIADLKVKGTLTTDQKSLLRDEAKLRLQYIVNEAVAEEVRIKKEREKADAAALVKAQEYENAIKRINVAIESAGEARTESIDKALGGFGRGDQQREQLEAQRQINREFQKYQDAVKRAAIAEGRDGLNDKDLLQIDKIKAAQSVALAQNAAYYDQLKAMQLDWSNGATRALENYYNDSQKVADQISEAFTGAFKGLEDALVTFATTGKLSFSSLANSIVADIDRIIIKSQITGPLSQIVQGQMAGGTGFGGYLNQLFGGIFGGGGGAAMGNLGAASLIPGMAGGGVIGGRSSRQVLENGPELLTMGNKTMLMMGSQGGRVTPLDGASARGGPTFVLNPPAGMDRRAGRQFLADAYAELKVADAMNN